MTLNKRKKDPTKESFVGTTRRAENEEPPSKRLRSEEHTSTSLRAPKSLISALSGTKLQLDKPSRAKGEDAPFPRGGSSVLTPLEQKQIQIEATRDVLFEQKNALGGKLARENQNGNLAVGDTHAKKRRLKVKGKKDTRESQREDESVKIEGLGYKVFRLLFKLFIIASLTKCSA